MITILEALVQRTLQLSIGAMARHVYKDNGDVWLCGSPVVPFR